MSENAVIQEAGMAPENRNFPQIKVRHLRCLIEVAKTGQVRKAAETLHITDAAVSKTLHELENTLHFKLFERSHRGMALTDAGKKYVHYASYAVDALRAGEHIARGVDASSSKPLKVAAMPAVAALLLPPTMLACLDRPQQYAIDIISGSDVAVLDKTRSGIYDMALIRLPEPGEMRGLTFEQLYIDRYIFVTRNDHPLAVRPAVVPRDIQDFPLILPTSVTLTSQEIQRFFVQHRIEPRAGSMEIMQYFDLGRQLVESSSALIWVTSEKLVTPLLDAGRLVRLPIGQELLSVPIGIVCAAGADSTASAARNDFLRKLRTSANALARRAES